MKIPFPNIVEKGRIREGPYGSNPGDSYGLFALTTESGSILRIMANDAGADNEWWEHVSVSAGKRTPTWEEMCWIKDLFWNEHECVVQYHPPRSEYVNCHPFCLHLWRPARTRDLRRMPIPPSYLVGPK
jgi:hypothetical protein